jgi:hypothetical protein
VPDTFDPEYVPKGRSPTRVEVARLVPHLSPDSAAAVAFILATSAEDSALRRARRGDVPANLDEADVRVPIRGTKNRRRNRLVAIVTDEQRALLEYALRFGEGRGDALFGSLDNLRRDLATAAAKAGIAHVSPHDLRRACGQWLIDLGVPLELVSRVMGHADTRITELVYAKVKDEDVVDRMIDALDPRYARRAINARGKKKMVKTIRALPEPKQQVLYDVNGTKRTLADWAVASGVPKTTLFHRVLKVGMSMAEALALGRGTRGRRLAPSAVERLKRIAIDIQSAKASRSFENGTPETSRKSRGLLWRRPIAAPVPQLMWKKWK